MRAKGIVLLAGERHPFYFERLDRADAIALREIRAEIPFDPVAILIGVHIDPGPIEEGVERLVASAKG